MVFSSIVYVRSFCSIMAYMAQAGVQPRIGCAATRPSTRAWSRTSGSLGFGQQGHLPGSKPLPDLFDKVHAATACVGTSRGPRRQVTRMMPVGVPKVPYRTPRSNSWQWVDLWNVLYRERIIFLSKPMDDELGNQLVATMLYLDSESKKDLQLYINCSGGEVVPTLAIHDTMQHVRSDVLTAGFGGCVGMMGYLLAMGKRGKRYALPNTVIMLHHPSGAARGQASDIQNESKELSRIRNYMNNALSTATGQPLEKVQKDFNRNKYFSADEAKDYGVIDKLLYPPKKRN